MTASQKSKKEITEKNLKLTCWRNGMSVSDLARKFQRSDSLLYRAAAFPELYPALYRQICAALPHKITNEQTTDNTAANAKAVPAHP